VSGAGRARIAAYVFLALAFGSLIVPLLPGAEALPVWKHHLVHGGVLALSAASGLLFARRREPDAAEPGSGLWIIFTVFAPVASMFLMWPTTYEWFEAHPAAHASEHFCFIVLGFVAAYAGERYVRGVGWVSAIATVATAVAAAAGFGVVIGR
jgi:hypothetical protein